MWRRGTKFLFCHVLWMTNPCLVLPFSRNSMLHIHTFYQRHWIWTCWVVSAKQKWRQKKLGWLQLICAVQKASCCFTHPATADIGLQSKWACQCIFNSAVCHPWSTETQHWHTSDHFWSTLVAKSDQDCQLTWFERPLPARSLSHPNEFPGESGYTHVRIWTVTCDGVLLRA